MGPEWEPHFARNNHGQPERSYKYIGQSVLASLCTLQVPQSTVATPLQKIIGHALCAGILMYLANLTRQAANAVTMSKMAKKQQGFASNTVVS